VGMGRCIYTSRNFLWSYTVASLDAVDDLIYTSRNFLWSYTRAAGEEDD